MADKGATRGLSLTQQARLRHVADAAMALLPHRGLALRLTLQLLQPLRLEQTCRYGRGQQLGTGLQKVLPGLHGTLRIKRCSSATADTTGAHPVSSSRTQHCVIIILTL